MCYLLRNLLTKLSVPTTPVYVLMFLKAVYTVANLCISLCILSLRNFSTNLWQRYTLYQFFSLPSLSCKALSAISFISTDLIVVYSSSEFFSSIIRSRLAMLSSLSRCSWSKCSTSLLYTFFVLSSSSWLLVFSLVMISLVLERWSNSFYRLIFFYP